MIYTTNILILPLLILLWTIDVWVLAASIRLILGQLSMTRSSRLCRALEEIVDPIPHRIDRRLTSWRRRPPWLSWLIVIGAGLAARQLLVSVLLSGFRT